MSTPKAFAAPSTHLTWLKKFCNQKQPKAIAGVDMTYKVGHTM